MAKNLLSVTYFLLFWSQETLAVLRNHGNGDTGALNCTIHPPSSTIPCIQYTFQGYEYCAREKLKTQFPKLYEIEGGQAATWPGSPTDIDTDTMNMMTVTWRPRRDGSIRHLKGFEVMLEGISFANFGKTICAIFDLISMEDKNILWLLNATFEFQINVPGDFDVVITSLPLPPKVYAQEIKENVIIEETDAYHPNISVRIAAVQINEYSVNVSVDVTPELEDVIAYVLEVYYVSAGTDEIHERIVKTIPSMQKSVVIGNLKAGNYSIKVRPENKFSWDSSRCVCYTGRPSQRSCVLCVSYVKYFQVEAVKEIFDEVSNNKFLQIGVPSIAAFILVFLVLVMGVFLRRKQSHTCLSTIGATEKNSIYVLHAMENDGHANAVVKAFLKYLRNRYNCVVTSHVEIQEKTIIAVDRFHEYLINADLIVIIHSETAYKLHHINGIENQCLLPGKIGPVDDTFRFCIATLINELPSCLRDKTVSIRFDYTPSEFVIEEFSSNMFNLIEDLYKLNQYIQKQFKRTNIEDPGDSNYKELPESIRACKYAQLPMSDYLDTKISKSLVSVKGHSDMSLSAQTSSKHSTPDMNNYNCRDDRFHENNKVKYIKENTCRMHLYRSASMQTMHSYYISEAEKRLICPEFDEESENTLTDQMKAINDRYRFNLDHEFDSNDDCFTVLGTSV